jgi:vancomycin resistance protein YoaR
MAVELLNGTTIEPGETFSFNKAVGPRTERRGFKKAKAIIKRRLRKDFGGGVCQVAGTTHAAFLLAGLQVVEQHPHSRASAYIQPSLDATVNWGVYDLKVTNQNSFPVKIVAKVDKSSKKRWHVVVELYGAEKTTSVDLFYDVKEKVDFETVILYRDDKRVGWRKVQEPGTPGYTLTRRRVITSMSGMVVEEVRPFFYPPSKKIIILGRKVE